MKKILFVLLSCFPMFANAANMCVKNDTVMVVLDPVVAPTSVTYDNTGKTWSAQFSYGVVSGIAACTGGMGSLGALDLGTLAPDQDALSVYSTGYYCFCKMLVPVESQWVFTHNGSPQGHVYCGTECAKWCTANTEGISSSAAFRRALFGSANTIE